MSGLEWFKVYADIAENKKTIELEAEIGDVALTFIVRAFCWISKHAADGDLAGIKPAVFERAVRWTGEPGRLWAVLESCGFISNQHWHDWANVQAEHARQNEKRKKKNERQRRYRHGLVSGDTHVGVYVDASVTSTEVERGARESVYPSLSSSSGEEGAGGEVEKDEPVNRGRMNPDAPPPLHGVVVASTDRGYHWGRKGGGFMESPATWPKTVEELEERERTKLEEELPFLDGRNSRPTRIKRLRVKWDAYCNQREKLGHDKAIAKVIEWIRDDSTNYRREWERDGRPSSVTVSRGPAPVAEDEVAPGVFAGDP